MENSIIRKITVANAITGKNDDGTDFSKNMIYVLGSEVTVVVDGKRIKQKIYSIDEEDGRLKIYLTVNDEVQLWRNIPLNNETSVEYDIN